MLTWLKRCGCVQDNHSDPIAFCEDMCSMCIACSAAWLYNLQMIVRFIVVNRIIREAAILTSQHNNLIVLFSGSRCICQYIIPLILHHWPFTLDPLANFFLFECVNGREYGCFSHEFFLHMNSYSFMSMCRKCRGSNVNIQMMINVL